MVSTLLSKLRGTQLKLALRSPEFRDLIDEAAREIRSEAIPSATEATIEGVIERVVYSRLRDIGFTGFHPRKELGVDLRRDVLRGRTDSRIDALVIKYKRPSLLQTQAQVDKAREQLEDYLTALSSADTEEMVGFLTNGLSIVEVRHRDLGDRREGCASVLGVV